MSVPRRAATPACSFTKAAGYADASEMDKYRLVENIGKGSFGVISKVQRIEDGKEFALKQLDYGKMTDRDRKQIAAEVAILESLKHRNIVQLVQKIADPRNERIYIVMEYCTSGDLGSLIRRTQRNGGCLHEDKIWNIFLQITLALDHCHWPADRRKLANGRMANVAGSPEGTTHTQVLHRDLKPENVFLSGDFVKLGDFGLSKDMAGSAFTSTYVGTPLYMPPEILAENRYDTKSDIWSLGCLVFEMCALTSPFATAQTQEELIAMVRSGKLPPLPSRISPNLKQAIKCMLSLNPIRRPSTKDLLEMDEMKLHRRLFQLQNQTAALNRAKEEVQHREALVQEKAAALKQLNAELLAKETALVERERAIRERELALETREQQVAERENIVRENHLRVTQGMEMLREGWKNIREEKERLQTANVEAAETSPTEEFIRPAAVDPPMTRPPLEERKTVPVSSRFTRHPSYEDTPSKIPFPSAFASPVPLDSRLNSKISTLLPRRNSNASSLPRRLASKSLTNLTARAKADEEELLMPIQSTPSKKQAGPPGTPYRHVAGRTSIGSPGELERVFAEDITMATASFAASPAPSMMSTPFHARPRKSFSEDALDVASLPPTLIPAPTFVYRPEATPAKWNADDEDCPSPFIRRTGTAPLLPALTIPSNNAAVAPASRSATERERPPLSAINPQPPVSAIEPKTSNGPRKVPRSRSGTLHRDVLRHNAVRSDSGTTAAMTPAPATSTPKDFMPQKDGSGAGTGLASGNGAGTQPGADKGLGPVNGLGNLSGGAVRTRVLVGRDPARC